jgi:HlyD family secretion protein
MFTAIAILFASCRREDIQYNTMKVEQKTVQLTVTATGYVQPVDEVDVGTQVSGVIEKIYVDFNSQVKKGQLLAELDKSTLSEQLAQANARLVSAQSDLTFSKQNYDRIKQLYDVKAATQAAFEQATNALAQAKTNVTNAKASVHQAQVNLGYAEIYSPIDGIVLNRAVEQGQTVAASFNTPTLFTIANDLKKMQVEADVDEADIGQVKLGQEVTFTVDTYADILFEGSVKEIRLQPTVTNNVVTYIVIIDAPNPDEKLFPGMTASVTINTQQEEGLSILAEALSFKPTEQMLAKQAPPPANINAASKKVWMQTPEGITPRAIKTGLSDGIDIIVKEGLKAGDKVIISAITTKEAKEEKAVANPLMPQRIPRR